MKNLKKIFFIIVALGALSIPLSNFSMGFWNAFKNQSSRSISAFFASLRGSKKPTHPVAEKETRRYQRLLDLKFDEKTPAEIFDYIQSLRTKEEIRKDSNTKQSEYEQTNKKGYELLKAADAASVFLPTSIDTLKTIIRFNPNEDIMNLLKRLIPLETNLDKVFTQYITYSAPNRTRIISATKKPDTHELTESSPNLGQKEENQYKDLLLLRFDEKTPEEIALYILGLRTADEKKLGPSKNNEYEQTNKKGYELLKKASDAIQSLPSSQRKLETLVRLNPHKDITNLLARLQNLNQRLNAVLNNYITFGNKNIVASVTKMPLPTAKKPTPNR